MDGDSVGHKAGGYPPVDAEFLGSAVAAFVEKRFDVAAELVNARLSAGCHVNFGLAKPGDVPVPSVIWEILSGTTSNLLLSSEMFLANRVAQFSKLLLMAMPLIECWHLTPDVEHGSLDLNLDDDGSRPGLSFCSRNAEPVLIPDVEFIDSRAYRINREYFAQHDVPWEQRAPLAFWRGGTSGWAYEAGWRNLPRIKLCEIANRRESANFFDVGLSHVAQVTSPHDVAEIESSALKKGFVPWSDWNRYKYQIDIDGNTNAFMGMFLRMLTGSPILKITSDHGYRQWYYDRLIPWEHFVPVKPDMSDLIEKVDWLRRYDTRARAIGQSAMAFAHSLQYESEMDRTIGLIADSLRRKAGTSPRTMGASMNPPSKTATLASSLVQRLHGSDIYAGFVPTFAEDLQGWNSQHPVFQEFVERFRPKIIIDVGVWKGASTIFLARLLKQNLIDGAVIGVDTFLGSPEHWIIEGGMFNLIPRRHGAPMLYEQFLCNVVRCGVQDTVVPLPQTSDVAQILLWRAGIRAGLIHIDASHEYEAVLRDARVYWDLLEPGGVLIGDDYHESWPGVVKAADQMAAEVGIGLQVAEPKWILRKPG